MGRISDSFYYVYMTSILKDPNLMIKNHHGVWESVSMHLDRLTTNTETHNIIASVMSIASQTMGQHTCRHMIYRVVARETCARFFCQFLRIKKSLESSREEWNLLKYRCDTFMYRHLDPVWCPYRTYSNFLYQYTRKMRFPR